MNIASRCKYSITINILYQDKRGNKLDCHFSLKEWEDFISISDLGNFSEKITKAMNIYWSNKTILKKWKNNEK